MPKWQIAARDFAISQNSRQSAHLLSGMFLFRPVICFSFLRFRFVCFKPEALNQRTRQKEEREDKKQLFSPERSVEQFVVRAIDSGFCVVNLSNPKKKKAS